MLLMQVGENERLTLTQCVNEDAKIFSPLNVFNGLAVLNPLKLEGLCCQKAIA